jgi:uncharacterized protein (DUF2147 family)
MIMPFMPRLAVAAVLFAASFVPAFAGGVAKPSPVGAWQSSDGQARVRVTMCGDGTQLCAQLTALSGEARTPKNLQLLNSYVVDRAQLADTNVWQGTVHLNGQTASGHITLVSSNTITVSGCQLGMCKTFQFQRIPNRLASPTVAVDTVAQMSPRTVGLTLKE